MKSFSRKHPRKAPVSPETEKPFFHRDRTREAPFFSPSIPTVVQPSLMVGKPNDVYEQEADAIAKSVMNQFTKASETSHSENQIYRQAMEEDETAQAKPEIMRMEKQEEDKSAQTKPEIMRMEKQEEETPAQAKPNIMRMEKQEEEAVQTKAQEDEEPVQTKAEAGYTAQSVLSQRLNDSKGKGQPLPAQVQEEMGKLFNYDFSKVSIHTGEAAVQMTSELQAQAFTHEQDIYFNEGKYNPDTSSGKELLVHELTHVVQQSSAHAISPIQNAAKGT